MIQIKKFVFNDFSENTYILSDESGKAIIIDPGCYYPEEQAALLAYMNANKLVPERLVNTHCHIDHVLGNSFVFEKFGLKPELHQIELPYLNAVPTYAPNYGFHLYRHVDPGVFLKEGEPLFFGISELKIRLAPGHSAGHLIFISNPGSFIIAGDVIFDGSIGRTDLPGGDFDTLIESIHREVFTLPENYTIYSGHGGETTVGKEKKYNPFCGELAKNPYN